MNWPSRGKRLEEFRAYIQRAYSAIPTGCGGGFDEIICHELYDQPVNVPCNLCHNSSR